MTGIYAPYEGAPWKPRLKCYRGFRVTMSVWYPEASQAGLPRLGRVRQMPDHEGGYPLRTGDLIFGRVGIASP